MDIPSLASVRYLVLGVLQRHVHVLVWGVWPACPLRLRESGLLGAILVSPSATIWNRSSCVGVVIARVYR